MPPTTRMSLEEEEWVVLESWVDSEFGDWITSSLTALSACGESTLELEMTLELKLHFE